MNMTLCQFLRVLFRKLNKSSDSTNHSRVLCSAAAVIGWNSQLAELLGYLPGLWCLCYDVSRLSQFSLPKMVLKRIPNTSLFCISGQAVWPQFTESGGNSGGSCGGAGRYQRRWRHRHPHQWCSGAATRKLRFKEFGVPWFRPDGSQWTRNIQWQRWDN